MKSYKTFLTGAVLGIAISLSFAFKKDYFEVSRQLEIFAGLFKEVNMYYVDETEPEALMNDAITYMLQNLDPYTVYMDESEVEDFQIQTTGEYGGIGSTIRQIEGKTYISEPYVNSPSYKAGIRAGDELISVNGNIVEGLNTSGISALLKGTPGTPMSIDVKRLGESENLTFELDRAQISISAVPIYEMLDDEVGYIYLTSFTESSGRDIKNAFTSLKEEGMKKLVLDLRGNPGGLLRQSVEICNIFLPKNQEIVSTKGKVEEWDHSYITYNDPIDTEIPLVVLVSSGSASASEIVSGTIQDLDRGVVIGQKTYGKGLVQQPRQLSYGTQVKITTAKYYTPSGRCIQAIDYSKRKDDGSVDKVPDSLRTAYTTKNGRTVYDGGGIEPDIKMEPKEYSNIVRDLFYGSEIFFFANEFVAKHETIDSPKDFKLSDAEYDEFKKHLEKVDFEFETITEIELDNVLTLAEHEDLSPNIAENINKVKALIEEEKKGDVDKYRSQIERFISEELITRYYNKKGRLQYRNNHDPEIDEAVAILKDDAKYQSILAPTK